MDVTSVGKSIDLDTLYEEITNDSGTWFRCLICFRTLSRKQRIESHLSSIHGQVGNRKRKYKKYVDDPSVSLPKSTKYDRIYRSKDQPCSASSSVLLQCHDFTQQVMQSTPATATTLEDEAMCGTPESIFDFEGTLVEEIESTITASDEIVVKDFEFVDRDSDRECNGTSSDDDDSDSATSESLSESEHSDTDDQETADQCDETPNSSSKGKTFSAQEKACMAILALTARHCITTEAAKDIIGLLKVLCPDDETLQSLSYVKVQEVCGNCELTVYDICEKCFRLFPTDLDDEVICATPGCNGLRYKGSLHHQSKKLHKNSFVTVDIFTQLKCLLERAGIWQTVQDRYKQRGKEIVSDIIDGKYYKRLCEAGQFLSNPSNISFIFNTDGAPLYSSSSVSLWPVFLAINELPSPDRFSKRNMMLWGIWQGKGKPPFNAFFEPFTSEMNKLYREGIVIEPSQMIPGRVTVRAAVLLGSTDLQGKAYLLCMTQHNGTCGCSTCEEAGIVVAQGKGHTRCYPYRPPAERATTRTTTTLLKNAIQANQSKKKVTGMFDVTSLAMMPWFDIVLGMVPEYMHGCLLGITKTLLYKWFSSTNHKKDYFVGGQIKKINKRVLQMKPPDVLARLPRDLEKHYRNFKASELQSWLLYYALPCLVGFLPDKYLHHFAYLSEGIYILLGSSITPTQLRQAKDLLDKFYMDFQGLYGDGSCGLNVHNVGTHLADYVEGWGPLWAWSTFGFEDMNGTLMDFCHGTGNVCRQLIWMLHAQSQLISEVELMPAEPSKDFISRMLITKRNLKNLKEAKDCQIAGGAKKLLAMPQHLTEEIVRVCGHNSLKVSRIVRKGHVYFSKEYTRMVKRNACVVLLENGKVGEINFFIWNKNSGNTLVVYQEIEPDLERPFFFDDAGCHILRMKPQRGDLQLAKVEDIKEKVFYLEGNSENQCFVRLPNFNGVCG